jgi:hypothetical protein
MAWAGRYLRPLTSGTGLGSSRWLRLLFAREFHMGDVLRLWDGIFADDPRLSVVETLSVAMLLFIRDGRTCAPDLVLGLARHVLLSSRGSYAHVWARVPVLYFYSVAVRLHDVPGPAHEVPASGECAVAAGARPADPRPAARAQAHPAQRARAHAHTWYAYAMEAAEKGLCGALHRLTSLGPARYMQASSSRRARCRRSTARSVVAFHARHVKACVCLNVVCRVV